MGRYPIGMAHVIRKYDVFIEVEHIWDDDAQRFYPQLKNGRCFMIKDIESITVNSFHKRFLGVDAMVIDLCDFSELESITMSDINSGKVGSAPMFKQFSTSYVIKVANLNRANNELDIRYIKDTVKLDGVELDFGGYDLVKEVARMTDIVVDNVVNYPYIAKEFIDVYRDSDMEDVMDLYGMSEKQVKATVKGIINKYKIRR